MAYIRKTKNESFRMFEDPKNAEEVISLLNKGWTFRAIADYMGCSSPMISKFYLSKIESGFLFVERQNRYMRKPKDYFSNSGEKINPGNDYIHYLKMENERMKATRSKREKEARETIEKVRKIRKTREKERLKINFRIKLD